MQMIIIQNPPVGEIEIKDLFTKYMETVEG